MTSWPFFSEEIFPAKLVILFVMVVGMRLKFARQALRTNNGRACPKTIGT
jgi:hypothetical protein